LLAKLLAEAVPRQTLYCSIAWHGSSNIPEQRFEEHILLRYAEWEKLSRALGIIC
jgi:hypothetical protein